MSLKKIKELLAKYPDNWQVIGKIDGTEDRLILKLKILKPKRKNNGRCSYNGKTL